MALGILFLLTAGYSLVNASNGSKIPAGAEGVKIKVGDPNEPAPDWNKK